MYMYRILCMYIYKLYKYTFIYIHTTRMNIRKFHSDDSDAGVSNVRFFRVNLTAQ